MIISTNPATGEKLGEFPSCDADQVMQAVARGKLAQKSWENLGYKERSRLILKAKDIIFNQLDELALLISRENGKPVIEAISHDIMPVMDLMVYFAKNTKKILEKERIKLGKWSFMGHESYLEYYPYGVVGVISPWNFPFSIPVGSIAVALMAGNTVVLKPSEYTSLTGLKIAEIFHAAGVPKDVLQVVTGAGDTGAALVNSKIDKIIFTGSVPTGKRIMAAAADRLLPITLELGGKDPLIVLPDADVEMASSAAVWGAFCNSGQVCASIERVYVPEAMAKQFTDLVVEKTKKLKQGVGVDDVDVGCMTAEMQIKKVETQVNDAVAKGATVLTGGSRLKENSLFYRPTVLTGVDESNTVISEETFGPLLPIMTYKTIDEAVARANDSPYALNAYIWAGDTKKARAIASRIIAGTVNINESVFTFALAQTPWGGPKESGVGRTHGTHGLLDLVQTRHVHLNKQASKANNFWWYGYSKDKLVLTKALCAVLFGKGMTRVKGVFKFLGLIKKVKTF